MLKLEAAGFEIHPIIRAFEDFELYPLLVFSSKWEKEDGATYIKRMSSKMLKNNLIIGVPRYTYDELVHKLDKIIEDV